jgi:hypothetical protein
MSFRDKFTALGYLQRVSAAAIVFVQEGAMSKVDRPIGEATKRTKMTKLSLEERS